MVATSPRMDPRLVAFVFAADDPRAPIAETWRVVGRRAIEWDLPRPGYDTVRRLVHAHRRRRDEIDRLLEPVLADVLAGYATVRDLERVLQVVEIARAERALARG
jgi:hypothetical protein